MLRSQHDTDCLSQRLCSYSCFDGLQNEAAKQSGPQSWMRRCPLNSFPTKACLCLQAGFDQVVKMFGQGEDIADIGAWQFQPDLPQPSLTEEELAELKAAGVPIPDDAAQGLSKQQASANAATGNSGVAYDVPEEGFKEDTADSEHEGDSEDSDNDSELTIK